MPRGAINTEDERRLDGRVALIAGGSGGIGASTARRLAAAGAFVVVGFHKNVTAANELVGQLPGDGHRAIRIAMEDTATIKALVPFLEQANSTFSLTRRVSPEPSRTPISNS